MGGTAVKRIVNSTNEWLYIQNHENPDKSGHFIVLPPGISGAANMWIPWCTIQADFQADHFIEIGNWTQVGNLLNPIREYVIWQHDRGTWWGKDGAHVRFSTDGQWHDLNGNWIGGRQCSRRRQEFAGQQRQCRRRPIARESIEIAARLVPFSTHSLYRAPNVNQVFGFTTSAIPNRAIMRAICAPANPAPIESECTIERASISIVVPPTLGSRLTRVRHVI